MKIFFSFYALSYQLLNKKVVYLHFFLQKEDYSVYKIKQLNRYYEKRQHCFSVD